MTRPTASDSVRHAPFAAHASFDFGPPGAPAGFAMPASTVPAQNLFVGCRSAKSDPWSLLPFFTPFDHGPQPLPNGRFGRFLALAGDKWMIGPLVFKVCTPFSPSRDDDECFLYAPVVCGILEYDNTHSDETAEVLFGLSGEAQTLIEDNLAGFASGIAQGYATIASNEVQAQRDAGIFGVQMGAATALHFRVPPHAKRIYPLVLGFHQPEFYAARFLPDLVSILKYGLSHHARYLAMAEARDAEFLRSPLPLDQKARLARELREWLAGTRRLASEPEIDLEPMQRIHRLLTEGI